MNRNALSYQFRQVHVRLFDYDVFDRIVYLQLPGANGPLRVLLHTFAQY